MTYHGLTAEYRQLTKADMAKVTELDRVTGANGREYRLVHSTEGYEMAGSAARWTGGFYAVWFDLDGARHGRRFKSEDVARTVLAQWSA